MKQATTVAATTPINSNELLHGLIETSYIRVMDTWWTRVVTALLMLPAYLHDMCAVFSQGRGYCSSDVCPIPGIVIGH